MRRAHAEPASNRIRHVICEGYNLVQTCYTPYFEPFHGYSLTLLTLFTMFLAAISIPLLLFLSFAASAYTLVEPTGISNSNNSCLAQCEAKSAGCPLSCVLTSYLHRGTDLLRVAHWLCGLLQSLDILQCPCSDVPQALVCAKAVCPEEYNSVADYYQVQCERGASQVYSERRSHFGTRIVHLF